MRELFTYYDDATGERIGLTAAELCTNLDRSRMADRITAEKVSRSLA